MVPKKITDAIIEKYGNFPIALTGCRATNLALDCCEYDFVVLHDEKIYELLKIDTGYAEIHSIGKENIHALAPLLQNMQVINDPSWELATLKQDVDKIMSKALSAYARNLAVEALFYANKSRTTNKLSSLWLKCAGYYYLESMIAKNGSRPMPTHMLEQIRLSNENVEGITIANACLGLERANRSSVSRSMEAAIGLDEKIVKTDKEVVSRKAQFLLKSNMYTDCYFYLGYIARNAILKLVSKKRDMRDYIFMINIAMDLTTDQSYISKLSNDLIGACNALLKK